MTSFSWWARLARDGFFLCQECFEVKLVFECWIDADGQAWDVCWACQKIVLPAEVGP